VLPGTANLALCNIAGAAT